MSRAARMAVPLRHGRNTDVELEFKTDSEIMFLERDKLRLDDGDTDDQSSLSASSASDTVELGFSASASVVSSIKDMRSHGASANHDCLERAVSMRRHCAPSLTYSRAGFQSEDRAADLRDKGRAA
ncbi:hypothetical protein DFH11DRAFT_1549838 [Phellopilus nigrolimitatus]|nr:hypothetical protein DFH11DRAFT_1549838 [Phellopilus nigrolimitatus]